MALKLVPTIYEVSWSHCLLLTWEPLKYFDHPWSARNIASPEMGGSVSWLDPGPKHFGHFAWTYPSVLGAPRFSQTWNLVQMTCVLFWDLQQSIQTWPLFERISDHWVVSICFKPHQEIGVEGLRGLKLPPRLTSLHLVTWSRARHV